MSGSPVESTAATYQPGVQLEGLLSSTNKCYLGSTVSQALCGSLEYLSEQSPVSALMGLRVS